MLLIKPARPQFPQLVEVQRELASRSLARFVKMAWKVVEPSDELRWGWSLDAICEHLEAVTDGQITRLLMNVPPGCMKSLLTGVFWPAWEWGPKGLASNRFIGASHEQNLAVRDNLKMRRLVSSDWYQQRWPLKLVHDQNAKIKFENVSTGFRQACAVSSMTGNRGHRVVWDDPHSVEGALSDPVRETAIRIFEETLPTRLNDPEKSAIVVIMQRLHEGDVSGHIIEKGLGYDHLMLPMEFERERKCSTSIGFSDPRTVEGELLFPERFPADVVARDKKILGTYASSGQFQQNPTPRKGGFFEADNLTIVDYVPRMTAVIRYWDKAGTEEGGAYTAGVRMGRGTDGLFYVLDVVRGQWGAVKREANISSVADSDGAGTEVWIEQEPGSGGKESAEATIRNNAGAIIRSERPTGDKVVRAEPYAVQVEAGNVRLLRGPWNAEFIAEHRKFPRGKYKDQIDSSSGAFNKLVGPKGAKIFVRTT